MPGKRKSLLDKPRPLPQNKLRAWRNFRRFTLEYVGAQTGLAVSFISEVENRREDFSGKTLLQLAQVYGTTPGALLDHDPREMDDEIISTWETLRRQGHGNRARSILRALVDQDTSDP